MNQNPNHYTKSDEHMATYGLYRTYTRLAQAAFVGITLREYRQTDIERIRELGLTSSVIKGQLAGRVKEDMARCEDERLSSEDWQQRADDILYPDSGRPETLVLDNQNLDQYNHELPLSSSEKISKLTPRELDVIALWARGFTSDEVGSQLYISSETAKRHSQHILQKLEAKNRGQALYHALRKGIINLSTEDLNIILQKKELVEGLTYHRQQLIKYICEGKELSEIATLLDVSLETIKTTIRQINGYLGISNRPELIATMYAHETLISTFEVMENPDGVTLPSIFNQPKPEKPVGSPNPAPTPMKMKRTTEQSRAEPALKPENYKETLGILAGRTIVKMIVPEDLINFENLKKEVENLALLSFLRELEAINQEQYDSKAIDFRGLVASIVLRYPQGKKILTGTDAQAHMQEMVDIAREEVQAQIKRVNNPVPKD